MSARVFNETLYDAYAQEFVVDEVLYEQKTEHQHLLIFTNPLFGRVMALDGVVQTTESDEFIYHEMLTHVPLLAHGAARDVLIIGGGDGGMLREVTRHPDVTSIVQVEIDESVVDLSREHLPGHSAGAFDDPRFELVIDDGLRYTQRTERRFDVIISDSTDPIGPGESLFTTDFYASCRGCLRDGGILVTQNGVPFLQPDELRETAGRLRALFRDSAFYAAAVPTYVGGLMTFAWASDAPDLRAADEELLRRRYEAAGLETRCYSPAVHRAAFALPRYVELLLEGSDGRR